MPSYGSPALAPRTSRTLRVSESGARRLQNRVADAAEDAACDGADLVVVFDEEDRLRPATAIRGGW
jgi:hypothetical protein